MISLSAETEPPRAAYFTDRAERLALLARSLPPGRAFPLLREFRLRPADHQALRRSVEFYLLACLRAADTDLADTDTDLADTGQEDLLAARRAEILRLPNMTPNGLLLPKREVALEFNLVQRSAATWLRGLEIDEFVEAIQLPLNVRIVDGRADGPRDRRRYASAKLHSDIWAGEPSNAMVVMVPLLGDPSTNVEFREPDAGFLSYRRMLGDYSDAARLEDRALLYDCALSASFGYLIDPYLLHRTMRRGGGLRVSIDFRFRSAVPARTDVPDGTADAGKRAGYAHIGGWYGIGTDAVVWPAESFAECQARLGRGSMDTAAIGLRAL